MLAPSVRNTPYKYIYAHDIPTFSKSGSNMLGRKQYLRYRNAEYISMCVSDHIFDMRLHLDVRLHPLVRIRFAWGMRAHSRR